MILKKGFLFVFSFLICLPALSVNWFVSPNGLDEINDNNGQSIDFPLKTIQYAVNNAWSVGDTIFVMDGVYRNSGYGTGAKNNGAVVRITSKGSPNGWLVIMNNPGDSPIIEFDGSGGFTSNDTEYAEISGFEIRGPNQLINYTEAFANRLLQDSYYSGRGITIWEGNNINIHHNIIHDCPNSGIRVNKGDYCDIHHNEVYNNTWWSSNAESAIVYATSKDIDQQSKVKMKITHNLVYDNYNQIPYYNKNYSGETSDYGSIAQDYIIDGSGCYITRNKDTYIYGWFLIANNIAYGNGINGVVVHKSDRAIVTNNTCFMNGAVPLISGRQASSGITVHTSSDVKIYNNISWPRYDTDFGYVVFGADNSSNIQASHNILVKGKSNFEAEQFTVLAPNFVDTINYDFSLNSNSYAIGNGVIHSDLPHDDFFGNIRDSSPDVGAVEYQPVLSDGADLVDIPEIKVYPNPFVDYIKIELPKVYEELKVELYDFNGKLLKERQFGDSSLLTMSLLGIKNAYVVKVSSQGEVFYTKVIQKPQ